MLRIVIKDNTTEVKRGTSKAGKAYEINEQTAYLETSDERRRLVITLGKNQSPYAVGTYLIAEESFMVDNYGQLGIGRLLLTPAVTHAQKAG